MSEIIKRIEELVKNANLLCKNDIKNPSNTLPLKAGYLESGIENLISYLKEDYPKTEEYLNVDKLKIKEIILMLESFLDFAEYHSLINVPGHRTEQLYFKTGYLTAGLGFIIYTIQKMNGINPIEYLNEKRKKHLSSTEQ